MEEFSLIDKIFPERRLGMLESIKVTHFIDKNKILNIEKLNKILPKYIVDNITNICGK